MNIRTFDKELIHFFRRVSVPLARIGLFVIFFWFGLLKVIGLSPATMLVQDLFVNTIPFMPFPTFLVLFGLFEMLIGVLFLIRGLERIAILLLFIHMITTLMPLVLIPQETWSAMFVPTLEGQYIIKNLALIATAVGIASHLHPIPRR